MSLHLGFFNTSTSRTHVGFQFSTHDAELGGNIAPSSAFEAADLRIYRAADGAAFSATQRSSANGITMTSPFASLVGFHSVDIDLTDNTDAGFYASGYRYAVVLAPDETIDGQTITGKVLAYFEIGFETPDDYADAVWASASRTLTAIDEDTTTLDIDAAVRAAVGLASANLDTQLADVETKVDDLETRVGTPTDLGGGATLAANLVAIEAQTDDIGVAGAGLTAIAWNPAWDAEVQSEVQDALDAVIADSVPADGSRPSISQALYLLTQFMLERQVVGLTVTVMKPDGATPLFTLGLNSATAPTTITRTT